MLFSLPFSGSRRVRRLVSAGILSMAASLVGDALAQSAAPKETPLAPTPPVLDCVGVFAKGADEAGLVRRFGRENVVAADLDGAEGQTERGSVVYPKDPARRIEVFWFDAAKRRRIATVRVRGTSTWVVRADPAGQALGLRASLEDVERVNEKPFTLNGFFWDMGGLTTGWKGGKLDTIPGGCSLSLRFDPDPKVTGRAADRASGEKEFRSSDRTVRAVRPFVSMIDLGWAE